MTGPELIAQRAAECPDEVIVRDVAGGCLTYRELHGEALRWATALEAADIRPGATVGSMLPNCVTHYAVWLGIAWVRALEVPINIALRGLSCTTS